MTAATAGAVLDLRRYIRERDARVAANQSTELPPVECKHWCENRDGHPGCTAAEDQFCASAELSVELSLEDKVPAEGDPWAERFAVFALQSPGCGVVITLERYAERAITAMTVDEVRRLVENLQLILGQIEAATPTP